MAKKKKQKVNKKPPVASPTLDPRSLLVASSG